ncbi:MAG TPA: tRNA (N6-isopentenyl adenosine(37)-C2)-methylthiotransferase MiaB [Patescibacteria group bacterium]
MKSYHIHTLGCQMNKSDSERISALLNKGGLKECLQEEEADLIIVNSCSVRQKAIDRIYGKLRKWNGWRQDRGLKTILTGCVLEKDKNQMSDSFDFVVNIKDIVKIPELLNLGRAEEESVCQTTDYLEIKPDYKSKFQAFVPIMTGCNNYCSFCVVPYTRGLETSRPVDSIISEIKNLVSQGCKEITLLGQNVNSYKGQVDFPGLLRKINELDGDFWVKFLTSHPKDMSDELIKAVADCDKLCDYIHLPVQSGDNQILKKMNRSYTVEHYQGLIEKIKKQISGVVISTDIIVGFPTETDEQFQKTVDLFKAVSYEMAYISQYSPRSNTLAVKLFKDDIPHEVKKTREKTLDEVLAKIALEKNKKLINTIQPVLVEKNEQSADDLYVNFGHTKNHKLVKFESGRQVLGQVVDLKIIEAGAWGLFGILAKA